MSVTHFADFLLTQLLNFIYKFYNNLKKKTSFEADAFKSLWLKNRGKTVQPIL